MENQITFIVKKSNGKLDSMHCRFHGSNIGGTIFTYEEALNFKNGDVLKWNRCDMYMTSVEGIIMAKSVKNWDYSQPIGKRSIPIYEDSNFKSLKQELCKQ